MKARDLIDHKLQVIEKDLEFYRDCGPDYADKIESLNREKKLLQDRAAHYDREVSEGYEKPATLRNGISTPGEISGQSISLDDNPA